MVSSTLVLPPGFRVLNTLGQPASGAQIQFFQAGTTTPRTVYADAALTQPIGSTVFTRADGLLAANQSSGTVVTVWTGIGAYKVQILDAAGNVLYPAQDNISGALDTSQFLPVGSSAIFSTPVITPVANTTLVLANKGQVFDANTVGGSFTLTLDLAVNLGNGWNIFVRNGGANPLTIAASGGQLIAHPIGKITAFSLRQGEGFHISCDGASFRCDAYVPPLIEPGTTGVIQITDIVTSAPVGPAAGARYIVGSAFSTFSTGDIIEASGAGTFFKLTPPTNAGWLAYVQTSNNVYAFRASAWALIFPGAISLLASPSKTLTLGQDPSVQRFLSGSGTYTPTAGTLRIKVRMCGGGGGGGAQSTNAGSNGGDTSFGSWTALHGVGGALGATSGFGGVGGAGGSGGATGTGVLILRAPGGAGLPGVSGGGAAGNTPCPGGCGGSSPFAGAGPGGPGANSAAAAGLAAAANSGAGGGGAGFFGGNPAGSGGGGGAGEYVEFWVFNPGATSYAVGAAGAGGAAGGQPGGSGAAGLIVVEEFYS